MQQKQSENEHCLWTENLFAPPITTSQSKCIHVNKIVASINRWNKLKSIIGTVISWFLNLTTTILWSNLWFIFMMVQYFSNGGYGVIQRLLSSMNNVCFEPHFSMRSTKTGKMGGGEGQLWNSMQNLSKIYPKKSSLSQVSSISTCGSPSEGVLRQSFDAGAQRDDWKRWHQI